MEEFNYLLIQDYPNEDNQDNQFVISFLEIL